MQRTLNATLATAAGSALLATAIAGQTPNASTASSPTSTYREAVVVTAALTDEVVGETPATVRTLDREDVDQRAVTEVTDLIGILPGVHAVTLGSPGQQASVFLRGSESDQTLVLWNGIPLNNPYFGGYDWAFLPTEGLDRVEVVGGAYSALYGSAAAGGVIQLITGEEPVARITAEGGENGHRRLAGSLAHTTENARFGLHGHWREGDGHFPNDFYDSVELAGRAAWAPTDSAEVGVRVRNNDSSTGIPFDGARASLAREIDWEETEIALPFQVATRAWDFEGYLAQVDYDNHFRDPEDPFGFTESRTESTADRGRASATYRTDGFWIAAGLEAERVEVTDASVFGLNLDGVEQETEALFAQAHFAFGPTTLEVGGRYDDNDVFGRETSPRLGLVWAAHSSLRLRASYGEGFRAPSLGELFYPFSGNPDLQPERSEGWELGVDWERGPFHLDLATYENRFSNLIDYDFATGTNVNVGRARTRGTEVSAGYRSSFVDLSAQWTMLEAENRVTGQALLRRPEDSGSVRATFKPGRWTFDTTSRYYGERPDVDPVTFLTTSNDSYLRHDLAARWQATAHLAAYVRVVNATDEEYEEALGFPAPGRTLTAGITLSR